MHNASHPAVLQQVAAPQPRLLVLLAWFVAVSWMPGLSFRALALWPPFSVFDWQHRTACLLPLLAAQVALTFGCVILLSSKYPSAIWIPRRSGRPRFLWFLLILLPLLIFHLCNCLMQLQAISDAAKFGSRAQSTEYLASLFSQEWRPVADLPTRVDLVYASVTTFLAPVVEETLFTGFLLNAISKPCGFIAAALGVALCFTFMHAFKVGVGVILIPLFFASLTYSAIRIWCGSLLLAMLAHCAVNGVIFIPKWVVAAIYLGRV